MLDSVGKRFDLSFLTPPTNESYRCKVVYENDILSVEFLPYVKREIKTLRIVESDIDYSRKFVDRKELDRLFGLRAEADDVLIVKNSLLTDTTIANVAFLDKNGIWNTPKKALLKGTMRQKLINEGFLKEVDISVEDIKKFEEVAIMNALRGFEPLGRIEEGLGSELAKL